MSKELACVVVLIKARIHTAAASVLIRSVVTDVSVERDISLSLALCVLVSNWDMQYTLLS